jgi:hypothetical protein
LKDGRKGKATQEKQFSRGVAFLEFSEHQHALVALRVLNNNPGNNNINFSTVKILASLLVYF